MMMSFQIGYFFYRRVEEIEQTGLMRAFLDALTERLGVMRAAIDAELAALETFERAPAA